MRDRRQARDDYRALLAAGAGWTPPWYIREPMGKWLFRDATPRMAAATAVLALRDEVQAAADAEGLTLDGRLEAAYESATDDLTAATELGNQQLAAIQAISDAHAKVDVEPDLVAQLGLIGETAPSVPYEAARAAFGAGDLAGALSNAQATVAIVTRAPIAGQERIVMGAVVLVALLALLVFFTLLRRRRRRRPLGVAPGSPAFAALDARFAPGSMDPGSLEPAAAAASPPAASSTAAESPAASSTAAESTGPSGTLGADPEVLSSSPDGTQPDRDGGPTERL
jgi:hypothetical protein